MTIFRAGMKVRVLDNYTEHSALRGWVGRVVVVREDGRIGCEFIGWRGHNRGIDCALDCGWWVWSQFLEPVNARLREWPPKERVERHKDMENSYV